MSTNPQAAPAVSLRGVSVVRGGTTILRDINWQLPRGATATILGPNGSGKTTLTRVLTAYEWPTSGEVSVLGEQLGQTDVRDLRQRVQIVNPAARFGLNPNLTARDAVITGYTAALSLFDTPSTEQKDHAERLLKAVGMRHRVSHRFGLLSTGEQRRCLLARALVRLPDILILDEPTAGLDVSGREHLLATIERLHGLQDGPTIITVTHHVEEISPTCQHVLMLRDGAVLAAGSPDQVITPEVLTDLLGCKVFVQKRGGRHWLEVLPEAWLQLIQDG